MDENLNYFALGHSLTNNNSIQGKCYNANIQDIQKSKSNSLGTFLATLDYSSPIATITSDSNHGINGIYYLNKNDFNLIETSSRFLIQTGDAQILFDSGNGLTSYNIKINSIDYLHPNQNLNIEIIDEDLINLTGGIVQGMSGSPIVQNGKLVGAINFANSQNPLLGMGIFIDKIF